MNIEKTLKNITENIEKDKKNKSAEKKQKTLVLIEQDKYDKIKKNNNNNKKKPRNNWNNQRTQVIYRDVPAPIQRNQYYNKPNIQDWGYSRPDTYTHITLPTKKKLNKQTHDYYLQYK